MSAKHDLLDSKWQWFWQELVASCPYDLSKDSFEYYVHKAFNHVHHVYHSDKIVLSVKFELFWTKLHDYPDEIPTRIKSHVEKAFKLTYNLPFSIYTK